MELLPFFLLGLLGSLHCVGMCGGFSAAVAVASGPGRGRLVLHQVLFGLGKAMTYAVLGLLVSRGAHGVFHAGGPAPELARLQTGLAWVAGGVMVVAGLSALGWRRAESGGGSVFSRWTGRVLDPLMGAARSMGGPGGAFSTGMVTGLLPCGLSWSALALAPQVEPVSATLGLFVFGVGTAPALILVGCGAVALPLGVRGRLLRVGGVLLVGFGVLTVLRGGLPGAPELRPDCCETGAVVGLPD